MLEKSPVWRGTSSATLDSNFFKYTYSIIALQGCRTYDPLLGSDFF